jgi:gliding motility-associated-like protein
MKPNTRTTLRFLTLAILLLCASNITAQIAMRPPVPAGGTGAFTKICAGIDTGSGPFNSYDITISWAGALPNAGNEFILELSDANGDFTTPIELARVTDQNTNTAKEFDVNFSIPTDTRGSGYKFRARSTDNVSSAESDNSYHVYYMNITNNLNISELGDGNPPGNICSTNAITLQVDNIANPETYQYQWYRGGTLLAETGHTILADTSGMYQALVDYGDCTFNGNTDSNFVTVTIGAAGSGVNITTPTQTALCAGQTETLTVEMPDGSANYQWYQNGTIISGATGTSFVVDGSTPGFEGDYEVEISGSGICTERSPSVTMTNAAGFSVTRNNPANVVVLPSQPETLSVTTDAASPSFEWFRNGVSIGNDSSSLNITQEGSYYVAVTSTGACSSTIDSDITEAVTPASFEIIVDYDTAYTACVNTNIALEVVTINAIATDGSSSDVTAQMESAFNYQWNRNGTPVTGETNQNINLTDPVENGDYFVNATLGSYDETSNNLSVQLLTNETIVISSTSTTYCNASDSITISTTTDLSGAMYNWERDGVSINSTDTSIDVNEPGTYRLVVDRNGCPLSSNEITIAPLDPDLISLDVDGDIIFPEGSSRTVRASGGTAYQWFDSNSNLMSTSDSMTFTEEGEFLLIANIDNCEISRQLTAVFLDTFKVPNVITPNGDGSNDLWVIPNSYSNQSDVTVIIYDDKGVEQMNETSYANNWPQSSVSFPKQNMVFYYVIKNASETLKQGTITVIR